MKQESKAQTSQEAEKYLYPWLDLDDPRRDMTDEQILEKYIDLSSSDLNTEEKNYPHEYYKAA